MRSDRRAYLQALSSLRALSGTRYSELSAVLANVQEIAAAKGLTPSRLAALFLTIERNREWWTKGSLLSYGQRVTFPGSRLVWEYYPGQGIELQWLATFGEANGYYLSGHENEALRQVLTEALSLATKRAGGIAWEYMFHFDGGSPPWTSGLSQGTAVQAFTRAWSRLHEPRFLQAAESALGLFRTPPPEGVRNVDPPTGGAGGKAGQAGGKPGSTEGAGAEGAPSARTVGATGATGGSGAAAPPSARPVEYLEYSYAPQEHILNGFIQAVTGLYDYAKMTGSARGQRLFEEGDAAARLETPHYDTGAWSMYDQHTESDLGYHELLAEFLENLCGRTRSGEPTALSPGGQPAEREAIPGDDIYCVTAERFRADLHTPPKIELLSHRLRRGARAGVMFSLSKISTISLIVRRRGSGKVIWTNSATVESGKPRLLWVTPNQGGTFTVTATATDLAGNSSSTEGTVKIPSVRRPGKGAHGKTRRETHGKAQRGAQRRIR